MSKRYDVDYSTPHNPRFRIFGDHVSRNFKILELAEDLPEESRVRDILLLLGTCYPEGSKRDERGGTSRQINYVASLAGLRDPDIADLMRLSFEAGGLSVVQVGFIIEKLKEVRDCTKKIV